MSQKPSLLILCFSPLKSDARILKQIHLFKDDFEVTSCGFGEQPVPGISHIRIPDNAPNVLSGKLITLRQRLLAYWRIPAVRWVKKNLKKGAFDVIIANDLEAMPVALKLKPRIGVHVDLHEYSPSLGEESPIWMRRINPYLLMLGHKYFPKAKQAASTFTTVSYGLQREYRRVFEIDAEVVPNAAPYQDRQATPVSAPIRIVHSGVCLRNRNLAATIAACGAVAGVTLDLYLVPNDPGHLEELRQLCDQHANVTLHDPLPYLEIADTIARYDVGIHVMPASSFNNKWALPNKVFDYVQARLAMVTGPNPEIADLVQRNNLGLVTEDWSQEAIETALVQLNPELIASFKSSADAAAKALSAEEQILPWLSKVNSLVAARKP